MIIPSTKSILVIKGDNFKLTKRRIAWVQLFRLWLHPASLASLLCGAAMLSHSASSSVLLQSLLSRRCPGPIRTMKLQVSKRLLLVDLLNPVKPRAPKQLRDGSHKEAANACAPASLVQVPPVAASCPLSSHAAEVASRGKIR